MKIAMVYDAWDIVGGGRIHVDNICKQLILNYDCSIDLFVRAVINDDGIVKKHDEKLLDGKLNIIRCGRPRKFFNFLERIFSLFSMALLLLKYNKNKKYDIIHTHTYLPLLVGKICSIITRIPIVITIHGSQIMDIGKKNLAYYIQKWLLTKIKYNLEICVGKNFLEYPNVNKVVNIGNGVNIEEFIGEQHLDLGIKHLLFVGRLERTKGVDVLINAMDYIINTMNIKNIILDVVGYGYNERQYKNQVYNKRLNKYIKFHGKKLGKEIVKYYKQANLMVVPSRAEGFGIIILEAMASGVPVIATRSGGPQDIIQDGINGFLVEKDNSLVLAKMIIKFINGDIGDIDKIINNGYITIKEKYTWDIISYQIYKQYKSLIFNKNIGK